MSQQAVHNKLPPKYVALSCMSRALEDTGTYPVGATLMNESSICACMLKPSFKAQDKDLLDVTMLLTKALAAL